MSAAGPRPFHPTGVYVHLADGGAGETVPVDDDFWPDLISGKRHYDGRLVTMSRVAADSSHWEMHPAGEELLYLVSGELVVVLDDGHEEAGVTLNSDTPALLVPKGVWHRFEVREPGPLLFVTPGEGTEHRPL